MLGILLRVIAEELGCFSILLHIARTLSCSGNRVDKRFIAHNAVVGFRRRSEDTESAKIEIEKIWRRVDAAQGTIELKVITLIFLYKTTAHHNLENIASQTVLDAFADVLLMLLIGKCRKCFAHRMEIIRLHIRFVHGLEQGFELGFTCSILSLLVCGIRNNLAFCIVFAQRNQLHRIIEMVENNNVLIHNIIDIRSIILLHRSIFYRNILEISHSIEGGETIQATEVLALAFYMKALDEIID